MIVPLSQASMPSQLITQSKSGGQTMLAPSQVAPGPVQSMVHTVAVQPPVHSGGHAPPGGTGSAGQLGEASMVGGAASAPPPASVPAFATHCPPSQIGSARVHTLSQLPQWNGSVVTSTQPPLHSVCI